jgi:transposase InsO family protein
LPILVIIEYTTSWVEAEFVLSKAWPHTLPMLTKVQNRFGSPRELINDNASEFSGNTAKSWHEKYGTRMLLITLAKPRNNDKIKQINGKLKNVMIRMSFIHKNILSPDLLQIAINIYNRTPRLNDCSPYFLFYGTTPPEHTSPEEYIRESTSEKKKAYERKRA